METASVSPYAAALADLRRTRDHFDYLIASLEKLDGVSLSAQVAALPAIGLAIQAPVAAVTVPPAPARAAERRAPAAAGPGPVKGRQDIIDVVKKAGGSMTPGALAEALQIDRATMRRRTAALIASGRLVATGVTAGRRFSLPGHPRAKEAP